jgi:hypothetical protein
MFKLEYSNFVWQNVSAVHNFKPKLECMRKESYPIIQALSITSKIVSLYDTFNKNYAVHIALNAHGVDPTP